MVDVGWLFFWFILAEWLADLRLLFAGFWVTSGDLRDPTYSEQILTWAQESTCGLWNCYSVPPPWCLNPPYIAIKSHNTHIFFINRTKSEVSEGKFLLSPNFFMDQFRWNPQFSWWIPPFFLGDPSISGRRPKPWWYSRSHQWRRLASALWHLGEAPNRPTHQIRIKRRMNNNDEWLCFLSFLGSLSLSLLYIQYDIRSYTYIYICIYVYMYRVWHYTCITQ